MSKGKVLETVVNIAGEISPTLGKSLSAVTKQLEGVNFAAVGAGAAISGIAVGTTVAVGKAMVSLGKLGNEYNMAVNNISAGTGMVGKDLEVMSEVLKDVYGSNFGESMEDAAAGITSVYQATKLTGDELSATTKGAYALSDTFGYDVAESARAAKAMMENFGVSGEDAMSMIAAGAQNGLDYSGELIDSINEYSVQFAKLGFSADDMFNIFQAGADSGAWNLDKVGDAVKEFSIRSIDGSKGTIAAYKELGLNADKMMATFAKGGPEAEKAFQQVTSKLIGVEDAVERDAIGVALFGTMWEDLGVDAVAALAKVDGAAYDTNGALEQINSVKYDNIGAAFEGIKRQAEVSLLPLAQTVADLFMELAPIISDLFTQLGPPINDLVVMLTPLISQILTEAIGVVQMLMPYILDLCTNLLPILGQVIGIVFEALSPLLPMVGELVAALLPLVVSLIQACLPLISMIFEVLSPVLGLVSELITILLPPLTNLINSLIPIIQFLAAVIGSVLSGAVSAIQPLLSGLMNVLGGLIDFIINVFAGNWEGAWQNVVGIFKGVFNLIPGIAETVINACIGVINGIIDGINSVGDNVGITIPLIPTVTLPRFATGGFTNGLSIAGEDPAYPTEAIISFNPAYRQHNLAYWAEAGRMLGAEHSDYDLSGTGTGGVYYDLGGISFAPHIVIHGDASKQTIMEAIEDEYPEFIDMLEEYLNRRGAPVYG